MFPGGPHLSTFKSLWTMPFSWRYFTADNTCWMTWLVRALPRVPGGGWEPPGRLWGLSEHALAPVGLAGVRLCGLRLAGWLELHAAHQLLHPVSSYSC